MIKLLHDWNMLHTPTHNVKDNPEIHKQLDSLMLWTR
jgi:hypothetical protein